MQKYIQNIKWYIKNISCEQVKETGKTLIQNTVLVIIMSYLGHFAMYKMLDKHALLTMEEIVRFINGFAFSFIILWLAYEILLKIQSWIK